MPTLMKEVDGTALPAEERRPQVCVGDGVAWRLVDQWRSRGQRQSFVAMHRVPRMPNGPRFIDHLRSLRNGNREEQQRAWEQLEAVLTEDHLL